jgi:exosortase C (VPDSG-CTERM-specific)
MLLATKVAAGAGSSSHVAGPSSSSNGGRRSVGAGTDEAVPSISGSPTAYCSLLTAHCLPLAAYLCWIGLLTAAFAKPLYSLAICAAATDLHSYIVFVPFISAWLLYRQRRLLPADSLSSPGLAMLLLVIGAGAFLYGADLVRPSGLKPALLSGNDYHSLMAFCYVCFLTAGGFLFLGRKWMAAAAFPAGFLFFMIPLPDRAVDFLETASQLASAEAASLLFSVSGTPVLRAGTVFQLPGIILEVAQECSGIRSSWVLFLTCLLASHLLLKSSWRRAVLLAVVIPLGILRNASRILVIGLLCVHVGPEMIHSPIHHSGGPLFFLLSLVPLFLLLGWLRKGEVVGHKTLDVKRKP